MSKLLTEQKVLKKLGIENFNYLTKDKVIAMASIIDKMEPEVAKKALEQFPEFSNTVKEMLLQYKDTLDKSLETNQESVQSYYAFCDSVITSLQKQLENNDLSFEDKKYIIDSMLRLSKEMKEKDSENKKFIATLAAIGAATIVGAAAVLSSVLGGKTLLEATENDNEDC